MRMKYLSSIVVATLALAVSASAQFTLDSVVVESRTGGKNFATYSEDGVGFPNSWANSTAKSTAEGTTPGIGSRFNSDAGIGGAVTWFQVSPTLTVGMSYDMYVTIPAAQTGVTSTITLTGGTGLPATTTAFSGAANDWHFVGTFLANSSTPTIRFEETAIATPGGRFYADAVMFSPVPEPSTVALGLIGGAGLMVGYLRRRAKK